MHALLLAVLVPSVGESRTAGAQDPGRDLPPGAEGPLRNDAFLPTSAEAQELVREGDQALARARAGPDSAGAERIAALEAWHGAVAVADAQASIWVGGDDQAEPRLTEGVFEAVLRRLRRLSAAERAVWVERFEPLASAELERAGNEPAALARLEHRHPGTPSAARAALVRGDRELEAGRTASSRSAWERARVHAELAGETATELEAAVARRRERLERLAGAGELAAAGAEPEAWTRVVDLVGVDVLFLEDERARFAPHREPLGANAGMRPGLAFLSDRRIAVQGVDQVTLVAVADDGALRFDGAFEPDLLLPHDGPSIDLRRLGPRPPGWALLPAATEGQLVLVHGRTQADEANALLVIRPPATSGDAAELVWGLSGFERFDAQGVVQEIPELTELGLLEFQPGPVVLDGRVIVQARVDDGGVQAWLLGLDLTTGALEWKLLLAQGADLVPDLGRSLGVSSREPRAASQPLLGIDGLVFAGAHLGAGVLVDAAEGRPIWSFKNRRREITEPGWDGRRPLPTPDADSGTRVVLWAPFDSDHLYRLPVAPVAGESILGDEGFLSSAPLFVGESEILLGGSSGEVLVAGRSGSERTVSAHAARGGARTDALYLGPDEEFRGRGRIAPERVLIASDRGVYAFDRTRDLYLLDYEPLPRVPVDATRPVQSHAPGGDLYARDARLLVLGRDALWSFLARGR